MILGLQLQVTLQQNQKFQEVINGVRFIQFNLFVYDQTRNP